MFSSPLRPCERLYEGKRWPFSLARFVPVSPLAEAETECNIETSTITPINNSAKANVVNNFFIFFSPVNSDHQLSGKNM
jgi:hypothetical protein